MMKCLLAFLLGLVGLPAEDSSRKAKALLAVPAKQALPHPIKHSYAEASLAYGKIPMSFEANRGQTDAQVKFLSRANGYTLYLTATGAVLAFRNPQAPAIAGGHSRLVLSMQLLGGNPQPQTTGMDELAGKVNYFIGNNSRLWRTGIPTYSRVKYQNVYPGIDIVYYGNQNSLEYDFIVAPGADPGAIRFSFSGMDNLTLDPEGDLILHTTGGEVRLKKPFIYQEINGIKRAVAGHYKTLHKTLPLSSRSGSSRGTHQIGFTLDAYDASRPLVIDPLLFYSTYLGGSAIDLGHAIAVDASGNSYVTGQSESTDFPAQNGVQPQAGSFYAFVAKLNPTGSALVYSTFLGGTGGFDAYDQMGIAVDSAGNVYVTGETNSTSFPTVNPLQPTLRGGFDAFVTKLNSTGSTLLYSTYLGGHGDDFGRGIVLDPSGNTYLIGITSSTDFPTANPLQPAQGGLYDAFVAKLNPPGTALLYSTYLGGSNLEFGYDIAVDTAGNAFVTGFTSSSNFPTASAFQPNFRGGNHDAFVAKLNPAGSALIYSTYVGGSDDEEGLGIAVDVSGSAYVAGWTVSPNFPTVNPIHGHKASYDAFVLKFSPQGSSLVYSTYLGGANLDACWDIALDGFGNAYVTGTTASTDFPTVSPVQPALAGGADAFVAKLNPTGTALTYSTYLGGSADENPSSVDFGIAVDTFGTAYVFGTTASTNFPTAGPLQPILGGVYDAFVAKIIIGPEIIVRLEESLGQKLVTVTLGNGGAISEPVELKLWIEAPAFGVSSVVGLPTPVITLPPAQRFEIVAKAPLPSGLPFPGTTVGARLVNPVTGVLLGESICRSVPCN